MPSLGKGAVEGARRPISLHSFSFVFAWELCKVEAVSPVLPSQQDWLTLIELFSSAKDSWVRKSVDFDVDEGYNLLQYFHPFVRNSILDQGKPSANSSLVCYEHRFGKGANQYTIGLGSDFSYRLDIAAIELRLLDSGVGVLSLRLENHEVHQGRPEDILRINQFGRRLFPPFLGQEGGDGSRLAAVKLVELADYLCIGPEVNRDDFEDYVGQIGAPEGYGDFPKALRPLFHDVPCQASKQEGTWHIKPILDDRMFVHCWYGNTETAQAVNKALRKSDGKHPAAQWWYSYLFVDGKSPSCQNAAIRQALVLAQTNQRWADYGTYYAASRYAFVCLSRADCPGFIPVHMRDHYFHICLSSMLQRAHLLRFREAIHGVMQWDTQFQHQVKQVKMLYRAYLKFINQIHFREITVQDQGIELYELMQENMRNNQEAKDLASEISELHQYVSLKVESHRTRKMERLSKLGFLALVPTLITGFLGMNVFESGKLLASGKGVYSSCLVLLLIASVLMFQQKLFGKITERKSFMALCLIVVALAILLIPLFQS